LERLAHKLAGTSVEGRIPEGARIIAQAELELTRIRQAKAALIERALVISDANCAPELESSTGIENAAAAGSGHKGSQLLRDALSELCKLERYERRAATMLAKGHRLTIVSGKSVTSAERTQISLIGPRRYRRSKDSD
jgi:hypothetical protein